MATINELISAIASRNFELDCIDEDIDFVNNCFDSFRKYFNAVYKHVYGSSTLLTLVHGGRIDIDKYQNCVMEYDRDRRRAHDLAIDACNKINRMCDLHDVEHLCPEPTYENGKCTNRGYIADFVGKYMYDVFQQGREGQVMAPISIDNKFGDRPVFDATLEIAEKDNRNPDCAYKQEDINQESYEEFDGYDFEPGED